MQVRRRVVVYLRLLFRGVAHRRGIAALILMVAVVASAAAAVAPTYKNAAALSAMRSRMLSATPDVSGVEVSGASWPGNGADQILTKEVPTLPLSTGKIRDMSVAGKSTQLQAGNGPVQFAAIEWRQDECAHVVFVQGRCPTSNHEIALPVDGARVLKTKLGGIVTASQLDRPQFGNGIYIDNSSLPPPKLSFQKISTYVLNDKVVGLFTVPPSSASYWFGRDISAPILTADGSQVASVTGLVTYDEMSHLPIPVRANVSIDQPIDWSRASLKDVVRVQAALRALRPNLTPNLSVLSGIGGLAHANVVDERSLGHLVTLAQLQLLLLIGLVLISILAASMDRRRAELVIATLQGRHPAATAVSVAAEPVVLLLAGVIPGLILSVPLADLASHLWLRAGTPVRLSGTSVVAALLVTLIAAVVTLAIGFVAASRSLNEQLTEDARAAAGRAGAWIDIIAITLAAAGLIELFQTHSNSTSTPWSLLAPSLSGLAAGLALGRVVPVLLRPFVTATAHSENISGFLALRELRRDRAAWRVTAMVALALSLLTFAVTINSGASRDRQDRAGLIVGAPRVATVSVPPNRSLIDAVDRADPAGKWAMAARMIEPYGSSSLRNLSIDTSRVAAVAGWTRPIGGFSPRGLRKALQVAPAFAKQGLPVIAAGDVEGEVFGFNDQTLPNLQVYKAKLLPQLLDQGSLTDLRSLTAAATPIAQSQLGTTQITDEVWLGKHAPANALKRLAAQGLIVRSVESKATTANSLARLAETAGLSGYLAVAIIAAILAVALLLGTSLAAMTRQRTETLALTTAGLSRASIVSARGTAATVRLALAGAVALAAGLGTAHLAADLIPEAPPHAIPSPLLPLPVWPPIAAILLTLVPALLAEVLISRYAAKRADSASLRSAIT